MESFNISIILQNLVHDLHETKTAPTSIDAPSALPEARVLCLYTGGTIGMRSQDGGEFGKKGAWFTHVHVRTFQEFFLVHVL